MKCGWFIHLNPCLGLSFTRMLKLVIVLVISIYLNSGEVFKRLKLLIWQFSFTGKQIFIRSWIQFRYASMSEFPKWEVWYQYLDFGDRFFQNSVAFCDGGMVFVLWWGNNSLLHIYSILPKWECAYSEKGVHENDSLKQGVILFLDHIYSGKDALIQGVCIPWIMLFDN